MARIYPLFSSSKGNSTYIGSKSEGILIDDGVSFSRLKKALELSGISLDAIKAVFVTHEHSDHVSALEMLSKKYHIPIHMTEDSAKKVLATTTYVKNNLVCHPPMYAETVGALTVRSFPTPHDSDMSVGFTIGLPSGEKIGYATDIGHITDAIRENLLGSAAVVIESNHDAEMLMDGPYPAWLKMRIRSPRGHLSNSDCCAFLPELAANGTRDILLAHLSAENNTPGTALRAALDTQLGIHIDVARESEPTKLI